MKRIFLLLSIAGCAQQRQPSSFELQRLRVATDSAELAADTATGEVTRIRKINAELSKSQTEIATAAQAADAQSSTTISVARKAGVYLGDLYTAPRTPVESIPPKPVLGRPRI